MTQLLFSKFIMKNNTNLIEADKKLMNNIQKSKKKDDLNNLIIDTTNNKKVQRNIELVQYQTSLEFSKCKDQTEFDLFAKVIEAINKNMEEPIFPNYNYDIDLKNYNQSKLIKQIFEMKEVDEEIGEESDEEMGKECSGNRTECRAAARYDGVRKRRHKQ